MMCTEVVGNVRQFFTNAIPPHPAGPWPSGGTIGAQDEQYYMCAYPQKAATLTSIYDGRFITNRCNNVSKVGISLTGAFFSGYAARWFQDSSGMDNRDWLIEATTLGIDDNGSHVAGDRYHYHKPAHRYYLDSLGIDGSFHSPILGYAADGFPMYYRYVYADPMDSTSAIVDLQSCYQLKPGNRPGDGFMAPDGPYDGTYFQDWEYAPGPGCELDECNGRFGVTPDFPGGTYYYVMTDGFPDLPRCFYGAHPDVSFRVGGNCPPTTAAMDGSTTSLQNDLLRQPVGISIYPNPVSDFLYIMPDDETKFQVETNGITIYSATGKMVKHFESTQKGIGLTELAEGVYFLEISSDKGQVTQKLIIKK